MATLAFAAVGGAIGSAVGGSILGVSSAVIGQAIGAAVGSYVDGLLLSSNQTTKTEGPRQEEFSFNTSSEGQPITRGYGYFRTGGNLIWATEFLEDVDVDRETVGGKGGGGGGQTVETTTYSYTCSFAIAICEGQIGLVNKIWADSEPLDPSGLNYRIYRGSETQSPDFLIESIEGDAPAFRGIAYVVFEDFPLGSYGNRIPQFTFEVNKPVKRQSDSPSFLIEGVNLLPGSGEFLPDTNSVKKYEEDGSGDRFNFQWENRNSTFGRSNWRQGTLQLENAFPNLNIVNFVSTWYADDLRCDQCQIKPKIEFKDKLTEDIQWQVDIYQRNSSQIEEVSRSGGGPAFGGTFSDASAVRGIEHLKGRGIKVLYYPFIQCDIPSGNTLPNPYSNNASGVGQPVYPWRGRITCSPAIGFTGSPDKTATAGTQVDTFYGTCTAADFTLNEANLTITCAKPTEWSYSRFILHQAAVCKLAGGVDYFAIGTEMPGMTTIRESSSSFPFVDNLVTLAGEVATLLAGTGTKIVYAADWTEYHSYRPDDGSNDVYFNMDPLWSNSNIDAICIDNYMPMSDWRDGEDHLDFEDWDSLYNVDYLKSQIEGGELYDYFYASFNDRVNQVRTTIVDTAEGKDWVFRQKDVRNWWKNSHFDRPSGAESASSTSWVPSSKPVIFTEFGVPAIDKSTNQPNVFFDVKSSESALPYFSSGVRDEDIQKLAIIAFIEKWTEITNEETNFVDMSLSSVWAYDMRPWPSFPVDSTTWGDTENFGFGHWLNGRIDGVWVPDLLYELSDDYNITFGTDFERAYGSFYGFNVAGKESFRSIVEPLAGLYHFRVIESGNTFKAMSRKTGTPIQSLDEDSIVESQEIDDVKYQILQESDLPKSVDLVYKDLTKAYDTSSIRESREVTNAENETTISTGFNLDRMQAQKIVSELLYDTWARRKSIKLRVLPQFVSLEPGDVISVGSQPYRVNSISDQFYKEIEGETFDLNIFFGGSSIVNRAGTGESNVVLSSPLINFADLPIYDGDADNWQPKVASWSNPFVGVNVFRSTSDTSYTLDTVIPVRGYLGVTTATFNSGPVNIFDRDSELVVRLYNGFLSSTDELGLLNDRNLIAVETSTDNWELVGFQNVELVSSGTYRLTKLIRGRYGTEDNIVPSLASDARVIVVNSALTPLNFTTSDIGISYFYRYGPSTEDLGESSYRVRSKTFEGRGLKPYSPADVRASFDGSDYTFTWKRRTRIDGDRWDYTTDVPLNENSEEYEVDVKDNLGTVVRTFSGLSSETVTYTASQQTADSISTPFSIEVFQISDTVGRGIGTTLEIT